MSSTTYALEISLSIIQWPKLHLIACMYLEGTSARSLFAATFPYVDL